MRWVYVFLLTLAIEIEAKDDETNEITSPINLDANLRRALLRALTELENEDKEKQQENLHDDKIVEKASASALSLYASSSVSSTTPINQTPTTEETTEKPLVVIQRSNGIQHKPITTIENYNVDPVNEAEQILTSASNSFTSSNQFFNSKSTNDNRVNLISNRIKPKIETTTAPTTTTEENQAKVEDVQFFSAPLVAAFTVHQDERGLPKKVEPIYRIVQKPEPKPAKPINPFLAKQEDEFKAQFALQRQQQALEEEISRLKQQQQQQQQYLIRQQQLLHEQQLRLQQQKSQEQRNNQQFTSNESVVRNNGFVTFQRSVSLNNGLPINAQQLPLKEPVNFLSSPPPFRPEATFQQYNPLTQQPQQQLVNNFQQNSLKHNNRIFRQESGTGNFLNNGVNRQFPQQQQQFFRQQPQQQQINFNRIQPPLVNHQLNNLLFNSGIIHDKQQEDLNIVSKVLSLNHLGGGGAHYRFDNTNINEQRAPFFLKKV